MPWHGLRQLQSTPGVVDSQSVAQQHIELYMTSFSVQGRPDALPQ